jgi:Lon protease-like protein
MQMEINLPTEIPVMTLPHTVLFPQALLPLNIFEPRYRRMLADVLATQRIFAVARLTANPAGSLGQFEPPSPVATAGIIRACQKNEHGTSTLLLQGLCRVEFVEILREEPYRFVRIRPLLSTPGADAEENRRLRRELLRLLALKQKFGATMPKEMAAFLRTVEDPETFVDLAAFGYCEDETVKQTLLETLDVHRRLALFAAQIRADIEAIKMRRKLQGPLSDDAIANN